MAKQLFTYVLILFSYCIHSAFIPTDVAPLSGDDTFAPISIPFKAVGGLIIVEAQIDDLKGNFIIDTGAPNLILNVNHLDFARSSRLQQSMGINGEINRIYERGVKRMKCGDALFKNILAHAVDLSHLENLRGIPILGLIGYEILKKYEIVFDHKNKQLLLHPINKKGRWLEAPTHEYHQPTDSLSFRMVGHIPCIITQMGDKRLRLGIDTGAEVNLFDKRYKKMLDKRFASYNDLALYGVSQKKVKAKVGKMKYFWIECLKFKDMTTILTNMKNFNKAYSVKIDGILGQEFIRQRKMSINFKKRKMYFWGPEEENCQWAKK